MTGEHLKHVCLALVNHKLSAAHGMILIMAEAGPVSMKDISDAGNFTASNSTGLVDSLCKQHMVYRDQPPDDRRKVMVKITAAGTTVLTSLKKQIEHV